MFRVVVSFFAGYVIGFVGLWGLCHIAARGIEGDAQAAANARGVSHAEYLQWYEARYGLLTLIASQVGGIASGFLCGQAAMQSRAKAAHRPAGESLTRDETKLALASCLWADLSGRGPDFVQGLIVGRLAESEPEVARKVDRLGRDQLRDLYDKVRRRKEANVI